jgi:hypothetical protein
MKKTQVKALIVLFGVLFFNACSNLFQSSRGQSGQETLSPDTPEGFGTVRVSFSQGAARTVMPEIELASLYLEYWFARDAEPAGQKTPEGDEFILEPGSYTLTVKAFAEPDNPASLVAQGTTDEPFAIAAGVDAGTLEIVLSPVLAGGGVGSLRFGLRYPAGVTVETLTLTRIAAGEEPINLMALPPAVEGSDTITLSGTKDDIPAGYYILAAQLINGAKLVTGKTEVVHIYQNLVSETALAAYTFTDEDFSAMLVTNANDSGVGSLRQAVIDVATGKTIRVTLDPGTVIELAGVIQISAAKTIIIEGNGVVLSPSGSGYQLLYVSGTNSVVTIRGVHFKDGRATTYGGAIRNSGTLTLESCIFSGNRNTGASSTGSGGAIYNAPSSNTRILTIRGCTFYGNSSGYYGGAVYSTRPLVLTGNLFYGNTGGSGYPVVYNTGTFTPSYNLVDHGFGATSASSGWEQGTGDQYSAAPTMSGKTLKPFSGSAAAGILDILPDDYPAADFFGNPIGAGAAAGASQEFTAGNGYYLELSADSRKGAIEVAPPPDEDGFVSGPIALTPTANPGYIFVYYLVNGVRQDTVTALTAHSRIQAMFGLKVDNFTDEAESAETTPGTLRYALANAANGDVIIFEGVTPGATEIPLTSSISTSSKSFTLEGNGVTLTRAASWTASTTSSQFLYATTGDVTIRRVHFKGGRATGNSAALRKGGGTLSLESCIFSDNRTVSNYSTAESAGAILAGGVLTVQACTFYGNSTDLYGGGAIRSTGTLILRGNLFYGNTGGSSIGYPIVQSNSAPTASHNLVDIGFGTTKTDSGWAQGTGDKYSNGAFNLSPKTFRLLSGSAAGGMIAVLPDNYPAADFYGNPIAAGAAAGAAQGFAAGGGYYLDLVVGNSLAGSVGISPPLSEDGMVSGAFALTPSVNPGYAFAYYLVNGVRQDTVTALTGHSRVQAAFSVMVNDFTDVAGSAATTPGTLRYALTNAAADDIIVIDGVPGATQIALTSVLPNITKNLTIEGNGATLTRDAGISNVRLLTITNSPLVTIRGVHFKNGVMSGSGAAISGNGTLTLESCVFSDNRNSSGGNANGGAIAASGVLTIRGCTFYGNSTRGGYGGALSISSGSLTLTGNVFFGNSGEGYPVVYNAGASVNASYNVTDTSLGTTFADSGWIPGIGDVYSSALPVSARTFKLLPGSAAANALTSLPPEYPKRTSMGIPSMPPPALCRLSPGVGITWDFRRTTVWREALRQARSPMRTAWFPPEA